MDDIILKGPSLHRDARHIGRRKAAGFFMYWLIGCRMYDVLAWKMGRLNMPAAVCTYRLASRAGRGFVSRY